MSVITYIESHLEQALTLEKLQILLQLWLVYQNLLEQALTLKKLEIFSGIVAFLSKPSKASLKDQKIYNSCSPALLHTKSSHTSSNTQCTMQINLQENFQQDVWLVQDVNLTKSEHRQLFAVLCSR